MFHNTIFISEKMNFPQLEEVKACPLLLELKEQSKLFQVSSKIFFPTLNQYLSINHSIPRKDHLYMFFYKQHQAEIGKKWSKS